MDWGRWTPPGLPGVSPAWLKAGVGKFFSSFRPFFGLVAPGEGGQDRICIGLAHGKGAPPSNH